MRKNCINTGGICDETYQNIKYKKFTEHSKKRWMRRMPDFMSVSL